MDPAAMMRLIAAKNKFENTHPKFMAFLKRLMGQGIQEGSVLEIKVTYPDGTELVGNMRVQQSDLEILNELKNMSGK